MEDKKKKKIIVIHNGKAHFNYQDTVNYNIDHVIDNDEDYTIIDKDKTKARSYLIRLMDAYGVWSEIKLLKILAISTWLMFFIVILNTWYDNRSVWKINENLNNQKVVIQELIKQNDQQNDVISWFNYEIFMDNNKTTQKSLEFIINKMINEKK